MCKAIAVAGPQGAGGQLHGRGDEIKVLIKHTDMLEHQGIGKGAVFAKQTSETGGNDEQHLGHPIGTTRLMGILQQSGQPLITSRKTLQLVMERVVMIQTRSDTSAMANQGIDLQLIHGSTRGIGATTQLTPVKCLAIFGLG